MRLTCLLAKYTRNVMFIKWWKEFLLVSFFRFSMCCSRDCKLTVAVVAVFKTYPLCFFCNLINRIQSTSICFYIYERIISISDPYTLILAASKNVKKNVEKLRRSFYGFWFTFYSRSFFFVSRRTFTNIRNATEIHIQLTRQHGELSAR